MAFRPRLSSTIRAATASSSAAARNAPLHAPRRYLAAQSNYPYRLQQTPQGPRKRTPLSNEELRYVATSLLAFAAAFGGTVLALSQFSERRAPAKLVPDMYFLYKVLGSRKCTTPSVASSEGDGEHVLLTIETPEQIGSARLSRAEDLALTASGEPYWRVLSVRMKEPSLQIERPYTPLYLDAVRPPRGIQPLELLIKRYDDGELGRYAHRLKAGEEVELRGPEVTWQGKQTDHLVLIVAGTGITPAYQLLTSIMGPPDKPFPRGDKVPRVSLLYAASKPASLLLLPELSQLQEAYGKYLNIDLFVESNPDNTKRSWSDWLLQRQAQQNGLPLHVGRLSDTNVQEALARHDSRQSKHILVCGPDGMLAEVAGPKKGRDDQGEVGGILARVGAKKEEVYKL